MSESNEPSLEDLADAPADPVDIPEGEQAAAEPDHQQDELEGEVNLKAMADDYAQYLVVNSQQDVSNLRSTIIFGMTKDL